MFKGHDTRAYHIIVHKCPECGKELRAHYMKGEPMGDARCKRCGAMTTPIPCKKLGVYTKMFAEA